MLATIRRPRPWLRFPVSLRCTECEERWKAYEEIDNSCGVDCYVDQHGDDASKCPACGWPWPEEEAE